MTDDLRTEAADVFAEMTGLPDIARVTQRGRDPETAQFTFHFADGRHVRVGTVEVLWSQVKLAKVMAVAVGAAMKPLKPADWRTAIAGLFEFVIDVQETPDETDAETVRDWLRLYSGAASSDKEGAAAMREPFTDAGDLYVAASGFARWIGREYSITMPLAKLRQALVDIGFQTCRVQYDRGTGRGAERKRTGASYYTAPLEVLE